jgi:hypothetical protein
MDAKKAVELIEKLESDSSLSLSLSSKSREYLFKRNGVVVEAGIFLPTPTLRFDQSILDTPVELEPEDYIKANTEKKSKEQGKINTIGEVVRLNRIKKYLKTEKVEIVRSGRQDYQKVVVNGSNYYYNMDGQFLYAEVLNEQVKVEKSGQTTVIGRTTKIISSSSIITPMKEVKEIDGKEVMVTKKIDLDSRVTVEVEEEVKPLTVITPTPVVKPVITPVKFSDTYTVIQNTAEDRTYEKEFWVTKNGKMDWSNTAGPFATFLEAQALQNRIIGVK